MWFGGPPCQWRLFGVLDELRKTSAPVLNRATKHWDDIYVSRFYSRRSLSSHGVYTQTTSYKLNAGAPGGAVEILSKTFLCRC